MQNIQMIKLVILHRKLNKASCYCKEKKVRSSSQCITKTQVIVKMFLSLIYFSTIISEEFNLIILIFFKIIKRNRIALKY